MPGCDGTGPTGSGPGSGHGRGSCRRAASGIQSGNVTIEVIDCRAADGSGLSGVTAVVTAAADCLGCGVCESVCPSGALVVDATTSLPGGDESSCTGCGECVHACVRDVLALLPR